MAHETQRVKKKARSVSLDNGKCPRNLAKKKKVPKAPAKTRVKKHKRGPKTPEEISRLKKEVISKVRGLESVVVLDGLAVVLETEVEPTILHGSSVESAEV